MIDTRDDKMINWKDLDRKTAERKVVMLEEYIEQLQTCRTNILMNDRISFKQLEIERNVLEQEK